MVCSGRPYIVATAAFDSDRRLPQVEVADGAVEVLQDDRQEMADYGGLLPHYIGFEGLAMTGPPSCFLLKCECAVCTTGTVPVRSRPRRETTTPSDRKLPQVGPRVLHSSPTRNRCCNTNAYDEHGSHALVVY
jgi:hypothetical protein